MVGKKLGPSKVEDFIVDSFVYIFLALISLSILLPILSVVSMSVTTSEEIFRNGGFVLIPESVSFDAYKELMRDPSMPRAFKVTVFITVVGTLVNMLLSVMMAYPLSKKYLPGRKFLVLFIVFTMMFNGGIIPTYLVVKNLGLIDKIWAMIIPGAIWTFNVLVIKSYFENLPEELFESARIDGAKEFTVLWQIALPVSIPVLITVGLFYTVGNWNQFWSAVLYIGDKNLHPLQVVVRGMLIQAQNYLENPEVTLPSEVLKMAAVVYASAPIIAFYPFLQKYFMKGLMLGAVKG